MVVLPGGTVLGLETPLVLVALPVLGIALYALVFYRADGAAGARSRRYLFAARLVLVALVVLAAAGPYTVATREAQGDPSVTLLVDRSASTNVTDANPEAVAAAIEETGVPVTTATIATGTDSRIGDGIAANLRQDGTVVVLSDGQVTGGQSLAGAAELASDVNATISAIETAPSETERAVSIHGPAKASVGVENSYLVRVAGVEMAEPVDVTVTVNGTDVHTATVGPGQGSTEFTHTFDAPGTQRVTARIEGDDAFAANDVFRKTVQVVERPRVLYVSRGSYPFQDYLSDIYDVETARAVPANLSEYYAVVVQDVAAPDLGQVDALQEYVIDGNGLVVVGGDNAYERGGYEDAPIASMLPVTFGDAGVGTTTIVFAIDVSGSADEGMTVQKSIATDALSQLGDGNAVGVVGFNHNAYRVATPRPVAGNRTQLRESMLRLQAGGATDIAKGLRGAADMLGDDEGTVILVSDGHDDRPEVRRAAESLREQGHRVVTVAAGADPDVPVLQQVAARSGGTYFRADETSRLRLLFGGASRQFSGEGLTIVDSNAFITSGVTLESNPGRANDVSARPGADYLVATEDGTPAVTSWRYGLGRVVSLTAYGTDGTLDGLLQEPDSLVLTKSVNYAIGDPERKETGVASVPDTRVGEATTITYRGESRPSVEGVRFSATDDGVYRGNVTPAEAGYRPVLGTAYAATYPAEYGAFGQSGALGSAVRATDGEEFAPDDGEAIAAFAREQSTSVRDVRRSWDWLFVLLALVLFLVEVVLRRLQVYMGRTRHESGLP